MALRDYIADRIRSEITERTRDRELIEIESSVRVFERAWGWAKLIGGAASVLIILGGLFFAWRVHDLNTTVSSAETAVKSTATSAEQNISKSSAETLRSLGELSNNVEEASSEASGEAKRESVSIKRLGSQASSQFANEATSVKADVDRAKEQIRSASELQPEMKSMQDQLGAARNQLQEQQKVLSSSESFVKHVFSSHYVSTFKLNDMPADRYVIVPPPSKSSKNTVLYVLLPSSPIEGTLQLQYRIFLQPPGSYLLIHNLLIFFWGDPPEALRTDAFTASYFPDTEDKERINSLTYKDGRVFADGEPLLKFGEPDPEFKGDKWIKVTQPKANP